MKAKANRILVIFAAGALLGFGVWFSLVLAFNPASGHPVYGVTFSKTYAESLGLDWRETYASLLDDLGVRHLRIPVEWDEVEPERGRYEWESIDWMLEEARLRGAEVILVVGMKAPRWPECHLPSWASGLEREERRSRVLALLREEVLRFRGSEAVRTWQVENEPLFHFGECPPPDRDLLEEEVALVRSLDGRPIVLTDSGELSTWLPTATIADTLGISMYRLVWNRHLGFLYWPLTPRYYAERIRLVRPFVDRVIISELQAEPWFSKPIEETPLEEQMETMDRGRMRRNVDFASRTGTDEIYLWGAEWWYWAAERGETGFLEEARGLFRATMN